MSGGLAPFPCCFHSSLVLGAVGNVVHEEAPQELSEIRKNHGSIRYPGLDYPQAARAPPAEASLQSQTLREAVIAAGCNLSSQRPALIFLRRPIEGSIIHMLQRKPCVHSSLDRRKSLFLSHQHSLNPWPAPPETHASPAPVALRSLQKGMWGNSHQSRCLEADGTTLCSTPCSKTSNYSCVAKGSAPAT